MRLINLFYFLLFCLVCSCGNNSTKENDSPYWKIDMTFDAPSDWQIYNFANAFSIAIPEYMKPDYFELVMDKDTLDNGDILPNYSLGKNTLDEESMSPGEVKTMTFKSNKSLEGYDNYSRIYIEYRQGRDGDFPPRYNHTPSMFDTEGVELSKQLIKQCLGDGVLLCILDRSWQVLNAGLVLDVCYRRMGHTRDSGSTTVHIFILKDYDKCILMTVSYNTRYKDSYKDLFNIVNTIRWTNPNIISR